MSKTKRLLDNIKNFDCEPSIYDVFVKAAGHLDGYNAYANFRTYNPESVRQISVMEKHQKRLCLHWKMC